MLLITFFLGMAGLLILGVILSCIFGDAIGFEFWATLVFIWLLWHVFGALIIAASHGKTDISQEALWWINGKPREFSAQHHVTEIHDKRDNQLDISREIHPGI